MSVGTTLIQSLYEAWVNIMLYECVSVLQEGVILELLPKLKKPNQAYMQGKQAYLYRGRGRFLQSEVKMVK